MPIYTLGSKRPRIHPTAWVHPDAVLIGDVWLGEFASVWPSAVIRADNSPIRIGARSSIQDGSVLHTQTANHTTIGNDCVVGHLVHLEGCILEDAVLAGSKSVLLERVICRTGSLVGAGSVVLAGTEIPSGALAVGTPAVIKPDKVELQSILDNAQAYVHHLTEHRDFMETVAVESCLTERPFA